MNGYILESKGIIESEIWDKPPLFFKVWHYLLVKANYKDGTRLKRGQLFTTINMIREDCAYYIGYRKVTPTKKEIWGIIEWLRNPHGGDAESNMIETTKVTHGMVVTICNYNKYQTPYNYVGNDETPTEVMRKERQGNNNHKNNKNNKESIINNGNKPTVPPTVDEVKAYCEERNNNIDAELFCDYYTARDWILTNGKKMKDWKAAVRTWEKNRKDGKHDTLGANGKGDRGTKKTSTEEKDYDKW